MTGSSNINQTSPMSLLLFVPAQNPLPVRYPHPHKPRLHLPPLVHRALHSALDGDQPSFLLVPASDANGEEGKGASAENGRIGGRGRTVVIPHPDVIVKQDEPARDDKVGASAGVNGGVSGTGTGAAAATGSDAPSTTLSLQTQIPTGPEGLVGAQVESEITFKLHLVGDPSSSSSSSSPAARAAERLAWVHEALSSASTYKGLSRADTLLIGWKGVDYKGRKTAVSEFFGCGAEGMEGGSGVENVSKEVEDDVSATWEAVRADVQGGRGGGGEKVKVGSLGTLYLPLGVLKRLAEEGQSAQERQGPVINMLDTPDCHSLPKEYTAYAKEQDIALWAGGGGEGADPLPDADLHNVLNEFHPLLASSIFENESGADLEKLIPLRDDELKYETSPRPAVAVKWALGYTVISKSRNVVKDKGGTLGAMPWGR